MHAPTTARTVTRLIWVSLPYATFGIITREGMVTGAAPIARWTIGKDERYVADYYRRKGAVFQDCASNFVVPNR